MRTEFAQVPIYVSAVAALALVSFGFGSRADAQDAGELLGSVVKTYAELKAYGDQGQVGIYDADGKAVDQVNARMLFARPDKLRVETDEIRVAIDKGQTTTVIDSLRASQTEKSPVMPDADTLLVGPLGASLLGSPLGHPQTILLHLLLDKSPAGWLTREGNLKAEPDETWNGRKWQRLTIDRPLRPDWRLWIDAETRLIGRIDVLPPDPARTAITVRWVSGEISKTVPSPEAWKLDIPKDYGSIDLKVEGFRKEAVEKRKKPESQLVGKPIPDFPMEIVAADGKTRQARISDFKGKPLVIDVWATWCGPCRVSLPELTKTLLTLDDKSQVTTILLSIDQQPDDGKDLAEFVRKSLDRLGVNTATLPRTSLALDRESAAAKSLNTEAIPMTVMVDSKGIVRKVHIGVTPGATLRKDIAELK